MKRAAYVLVILAGLGAAISVHALHNFGITIASVNIQGFVLSLFIAMCGLGLVIAAIILSWNHERSVIRLELAEELGSLLSVEDLVLLTGQWRQPLRRKSFDGADKMALYAELAIRKRRLRVFGPEHAEELLDEIGEIRARLAKINEEPELSSGS